MRKYTKILVWTLIAVVGMVFVLQCEPEYETDKVFSPDRQYSVFTRYQNKKIYEHFLVVLPGSSSNYHNCETILFDEEKDSVIAMLHIGEDGFLSNESNVFFTDDSLGVNGKLRAKLPRVIKTE